VQETYEGKIPSHAVVAYADDIPSDWNLKMPGEHNRDNAACALFALRVLGLSEEDIKKGFETFTGVEGRLQFVREVGLPAQAGGVKIYNDTTATTPDATIAGLRALDPEGKKNIILIMGGADKQLDMSALIEEIPQHCKEVILLAGTGTTRLAESSEWLAGKTQHASLKDAFDAARASAQAGDIILLSPAFASFGMFKNEYDRGDQFIQLVQVLS
ncbi:MAG TPA: cyanophycin synthetase, partial [Candidatus Paceibacterota bacterium]